MTGLSSPNFRVAAKWNIFVRNLVVWCNPTVCTHQFMTHFNYVFFEDFEDSRVVKPCFCSHSVGETSRIYHAFLPLEMRCIVLVTGSIFIPKDGFTRVFPVVFKIYLILRDTTSNTNNFSNTTG